MSSIKYLITDFVNLECQCSLYTKNFHSNGQLQAHYWVIINLRIQSKVRYWKAQSFTMVCLKWSGRNNSHPADSESWILNGCNCLSLSMLIYLPLLPWYSVRHLSLFLHQQRLQFGNSKAWNDLSCLIIIFIDYI